MDNILFAIFALRSVSDPVFALLPVHLGGAQMTFGALFNFAIMFIALGLLIAQSRFLFALGAWIPFLTISAASILWAPNKGEAFRWVAVLLTCGCFFILPFQLTQRYRERNVLLDAIVYSSVVPVIFGFVGLGTQLNNGGRLASLFSHPNVFGFYLDVIIAVILYMRVSKTVVLAPWAKRWSLPYVALLTAFEVLTECRGTWAGLVLIFAAYAFLVDRRWLLVIFALPLLMYVPMVQERLSDLDRGTVYLGRRALSSEGALNSYAWRQLVWDSALDDSKDAQVFGKGVGSFGVNSPHFFPMADVRSALSHRGVGSHSVYILVLYETGWVGLICYLALFAMVFWRLAMRYRVDKTGTIIVGALVAAYLLFDYSDNVLDYGPDNFYFWGFVGAAIARWDLLERGMARARGAIPIGGPRLAVPALPKMKALAGPRRHRSGSASLRSDQQVRE